MKTTLLATTACLALLLLAGCETRSISDSGYRSGASNRYYRGELTEAEVVGAPDPGHAITDADIQSALRSSKPVHATPGTSLLVVQSGALTPDDAMIQALNSRYRVLPFSGLPEGGPRYGYAANYATEGDPTTFSKRLRLAAAQGGIPHILCYWGTLESARENQVTKGVSWVPIAGNFVPDENQRMRINLHAVLIDVASGHWSPYTGKPAEDSALSAQVLRGSSDQKQVAKLKAAAYASLVDELVARAS